MPELQGLGGIGDRYYYSAKKKTAVIFNSAKSTDHKSWFLLATSKKSWHFDLHILVLA